MVQIRDETETIIELPAEVDKSDTITITGKKENVEDAKERILKIQSEMVRAENDTVEFVCTAFNFPFRNHARELFLVNKRWSCLCRTCALLDRYSRTDRRCDESERTTGGNGDRKTAK